MATPYLDLEVPEDLARFPKDLRGSSELADTLAAAMSDLLAYYTLPLSRVQADALDGLVLVGAYAVVCIRGYTEDPAQADPGTAEAIKRALVALTRWKLAQTDVTLTAKSKAQKDAKTEWREDATSTYPPGFGQFLEPFDAGYAVRQTDDVLYTI
jgi:hypothetical protein